MDFVRTFEDRDTFWSVCYPEDKGSDILNVLLDKWSDTEYLINFFKENESDLRNDHWRGVSIDRAVNLVQEEIQFLYEKLICLEFKDFGCDNVKFENIFTSLNKHEHVLKNSTKKFIKGKIDSLPQMLRLYGIILEDGTVILTGGAIKLTNQMKDRKHTQHEIQKLDRVNSFLKENFIYGVDELKF